MLRNLTLFAASCLAALLLAELSLRLGIALGSDAVREPDLYADPDADDDYWKLREAWGRNKHAPKVGTVHATLGWAPRVSTQNPLGVLAEVPYEVDPSREAVLFFGDSFVGGLGPLEERLPQQLQAELPELPILNYGVGGYGLDQSLLRFRDSHPAFRCPVILFGILAGDLDRALLSFRTGPKPYFVLRNGELELRGTPVHPDRHEFLGRHPPAPRSYVLALAARQWRTGGGLRDRTEIAYRRDEKIALGSRLLDAVVAEARGRRMPLLLVVFYNRHDMAKRGWREEFLRSETERLGLPRLHSKDVLQAHARDRSLPIESFFERTNPHMNRHGNRVLAAALAAELREGALARRGSCDAREAEAPALYRGAPPAGAGDAAPGLR